MYYSSEELKKALKEIAFDMQHFLCYVELHRTGKLLSHPTVRQAVIYSLLLHLRVLLGFFYGPARQDDVWVEHFSETFPTFAATFRRADSLTPDEAKDVSIQLHKRLAHLTATRWEKKPPTLNFYGKYFESVETLIERFRSALPDDVKRILNYEMTKWQRQHPPTI